jgi:hypothetical protein
VESSELLVLLASLEQLLEARVEDPLLLDSVEVAEAAVDPVLQVSHALEAGVDPVLQVSHALEAGVTGRGESSGSGRKQKSHIQY